MQSITLSLNADKYNLEEWTDLFSEGVMIFMKKPIKDAAHLPLIN